jgi:hypothetical protein
VGPGVPPLPHPLKKKKKRKERKRGERKRKRDRVERGKWKRVTFIMVPNGQHSLN